MPEPDEEYRAIDATRNIERLALERLWPFIRQRAFNGQYVVTSKGPLASELQRTVGDVLYNTDKETIVSVEIKAELANKWDNFFLETWSNLSRLTIGWMFTLRADWLFYYFLESDELHIIPLPKLQRWAFIEKKIYDFPECKQGKYVQLNDSWGRCVPIKVLQKELKLRPQFRIQASVMDEVA